MFPRRLTRAAGGLPLALALALALALLGACAPAQPAPAPNAQRAAPAASNPAAPASGPSGGGLAAAAVAPSGSALTATPYTGVAEEAPLAAIPEVRIALGADLVNTNPFSAFAVTDKNILKHFMASLTRLDENGELRPLLAESWELIAPTVWQFHLRRGVQFHNGEPFTGEAVKTTIEMMNAPETRAAQRPKFRLITDVQLVDDYTINVVTSQPAPILPKTLSDLHLLAPRYLKERGPDGASAQPIGAGPYRFVEWIKGERLVLEANPTYFAGEPAIKRLVFRPIPEDGARLAALLAGEVDLIYNVPIEMARQIEGNRRLALKAALTTTVYLLGLNTLNDEWPTSKKLVRQAISHALDRETLARTLLGGLALPLPTVLHSRQLGVDPDLKPREYSVAKAKQLLAEAGYPNGFTIQMVAPQGRWPKDRELGQAIATQLGAAGIDVRLEVLEYTNFTQQVHSKKLPMALWGWSDTESDPDAIMRNLFTCQDSGSVWSLNCVPALDQLAKAQETEIDPQKRADLVRQAQTLMQDEEVNVGLLQIGQVRGASEKIAGWYNVRPDEGLWLYHPVQR